MFKKKDSQMSSITSGVEGNSVESEDDEGHTDGHGDEQVDDVTRAVFQFLILFVVWKMKK